MSVSTTTSTPCTTLATVADVKQKLKFGSCLGKGAFASVYKAMDRTTKKLMAVKKMSKSNPLLPSAAAVTIEYTIGASLKHANIVNTLDKIETPEFLFICLELVDGGDLFSQLDPSGSGLDLVKSRQMALELAVGIQYLHSQEVVHCDLKPENVLVHKGHIKICDFGLAGYTNDVRTGSATGTGAYMAPELINRRSANPYQLTKAQDVWSFGIILYAMLFSDLPWNKCSLKDDDFKLFCQKGGVSSSLYPFNTAASPMRALLRGVLAIKASQRPSMEAVIDHMKTGHEWYVGGAKQAITSYGMKDLTPPPPQSAATGAKKGANTTVGKSRDGTQAPPISCTVNMVPKQRASSEYDATSTTSSTSTGSSQPSFDGGYAPYNHKQNAQLQLEQQHHKQHMMGELSASMRCLRVIST
jgi:serine/threonine protein kinase